MGLARVHKPEGLVSRFAQSKARFESAIQIGATQKCDQQERLTSAINRCGSQVRSTGATHKCDRLNREFRKFESLQVCKVCKFAKLESSQVRKFALKKHKIQKNSFE